MADPVTPPTDDTPAAWHNGVSPELLGMLQTRGWDKLPADEAARQSAKSYRELELFRGVPADRLLKLPENTDDADAMKPILGKLLKLPEKAEDYQFDGITAEEGLLKLMQTKAHELGMTQAAAKGMAQTVVTLLDQVMGDQQQNAKTTSEQNDKDLRSAWGNAYDQNMLMARNAAAASGVTADELKAMETSLGFGKTMEVFKKLAAKTGEDKLLGAGGPMSGPMTPEQALARRQELLADADWKARAMKSDAKALREMETLNRIITGVTAAWR